jgi:PAS domain-containing protein
VPLHDAAGKLTGVDVLCEDITTQKRAQKAAEDAARELDAVFEAVPVGLGVFDKDLSWKKANAEIERMSRIPASELSASQR